ncbi:MAG: branched-chain amino acid ABC transporter permease [Peptococcaceae bacterium]|nr:branched-chain amino acid ABC transporter permease [Peptococcaceae bacterium]
MKIIKSIAFWTVILALGILVEMLGRFEYINPYVIQVLELIGINIILVSSLNIINGFLGEFAIGHAGFMATGAYLSAICTVKFHMPFALGFLAAGLLSGLIAYLIGVPAFKTFGDYLAVITLGFNMIIVNLLNNLEYVGAARGMVGLPKSTNFIWVFCATILTLIIFRNIIFSNYGRIWTAIRENTLAAEMMGINVVRSKMVAFAIAGCFAGLAGALWGHMLQYINPSSFTYLKSTDMLTMLYLGGVGSLTGSVLGAVLMTGLLEILRDLGVWRMVIGPVILVLIMLTKPLGLFGSRELKIVQPKSDREEVQKYVSHAGRKHNNEL